MATSYTTRSEEQARLIEQGRRFEMARCGMRPRTSQGQMAALVSDKWGRTIGRSIIAGIEDGRRDAEQGILKAVAALTGLSEDWLKGDRTIPGYFNPWPEPAITQLALTA